MEAELDIPSHFLCPISLQIMRDPVTVLTGISYDRESIERWLSSGKGKACPVTKQPLLVDADLTPNHTLRRIIQAWCTLNAAHGIERIPTPKSQLDKTHILKLIDQAKKLPHTQLQFLKRVRSMAAIHGERNKNSLKAAGAVEFIASLINSVDQSIMQVAVEVLFHLRSLESHLKDVMINDGDRFIDSLVQVLKRGDYQSRGHATILLKSVFELADPTRLISARVDLFIEIVNVVRDHRISQQAFKAALKLLLELCPWGRNRIKAVESGAVSVLIEALLNTQEKRACELILFSLDQLCGCAEGRAEFLRHAAGLAIVSKKIFRVSHVASDWAVRILSSICRFSATSGVVMEMLQVGVVAKLCLVLQVDCRLKTKERAREVLRLHSRVWKSSPCVPAHLLSFYPSSSSS